MDALHLFSFDILFKRECNVIEGVYSDIIQHETHNVSLEIYNQHKETGGVDAFFGFLSINNNKFLVTGSFICKVGSVYFKNRESNYPSFSGSYIDGKIIGELLFLGRSNEIKSISLNLGIKRKRDQENNGKTK